MFKVEYIIELLTGHLTEKGYASILRTIASMVRKYQWQKTIVVSEYSDKVWHSEDIEELAHIFFEWVITNKKLKYLDKVPYEYLSYYFTQMLVSFIADRIKEEQQKVGISYQRCQELVTAICHEEYSPVMFANKECVRSDSVISESLVEDIENDIQYMTKIPIPENKKRYRTVVRLAIGDILIEANGYVSIDNLCRGVYSLLDQSCIANEEDISVPAEIGEDIKFDRFIAIILYGVSCIDAKLYLEYLFQDGGKVSLKDLAIKYNLPKSSIHKRVDNFKKKIFSVYIPENEEEGIRFLKKLYSSLDDLTK